MSVPIGSSAKGVTFGGFQRPVASFRVAGVALRDIPTCFKTCQKTFCVASAILLRRSQTMRCTFRGRRSTFEDLRGLLAWQAQHFRRFVFSANRIVSVARNGDKVPIPWQGWHFVTGDEKMMQASTSILR